MHVIRLGSYIKLKFQVNLLSMKLNNKMYTLCTFSQMQDTIPLVYTCLANITYECCAFNVHTVLLL